MSLSQRPSTCQNCEDGNPQYPTVFCEGCNGWFCAECLEAIHTDAAYLGHNYVDGDKAEFFLRAFHNPEDYSPEKVEKLMEKTRVASVDKETDDLEETDALLDITFRYEDDIQPSFISVLGSSGHGKSTLLRIILKTLGTVEENEGNHPDNPMPVSGKNDDPQSTTSDLHMYMGPLLSKDRADLSKERGNIQTFFFDTEGLGGTSTTSTSISSVSSLSSSAVVLPVATAAAEAIATNLSQLTKKEKKKKHVHSSYPKLVYLFSDVVCFVIQSHWKEKAYLDDLIKWASQGSLNIINQGIKPKLIIIFNKIEPKDFEDYENIDGMSATYFDSVPEKVEQLFKYFTNPRVVFIPHSKNLIKVSNQIKKLNKVITEDLALIREQRLKSLQLLTMSNFRTCFSLALRCFNDNTVFDFSSFVRSHELNDSSKWLIQLFMKCCKTFDVEKAAEIVKKKVALVPFLHAVRRNIVFPTGSTAVLHESWKQFCQNTIERCIDETQCTAITPFLCSERGTFIASCECNRKMHGTVHQSSQTYIVDRTWHQWWKGEPALFGNSLVWFFLLLFFSVFVLLFSFRLSLDRWF
jgi:energy-coupling factor transporter ATP-binding protein EcfA2